MKYPDKLSTLLAILAIAFFRAAKSGMITMAQKPVRRRAHSRPDHSLLIFGRAFFNKTPTLDRCDPIKSLLQAILLSKRHSPDSQGAAKAGHRGPCLRSLFRNSRCGSMEHDGCLAESLTGSVMRKTRELKKGDSH
jgi:hypothetical protein